MLVDELARKAIIYAKNNSLKLYDFAIGAKYSYAIVEGKSGQAMGTAYMPTEDLTSKAARSPSIDNITNLVSSLSMQEKSLGVSLINAISQYALKYDNLEYKINSRNLIEAVNDSCPEGKVGVVGNMAPLVDKLKEKRDVIVLERNPRSRFNTFPDSLAPRILPFVDTVIITGATLVNDSIDYVLSLSKNAKYKILVGPTASLNPEWIKNYVDAISSIKINDIPSASNIIKRGGGRWDFTPYGEEYIIEL